MKWSYDSIPDGQNDENTLIKLDKTWFRKNFRFLGLVVIVAVVTAVGLTVTSRSSAVLRNNEELKLQNSEGSIRNEDYMKQLFDNFIVKFDKNYDDESEYLRRFEIFKKNLAVIDIRNADERATGGYAVHGVTKFADYTDEEFNDLTNLTLPPESENDDEPEFKATSATFSDWRQAYVTAVKDQGQCGSCWAFASTEQIESDTLRTLSGFDRSLNLAPQQLVDCDSYDGGCNGGWMQNAWKYVQNAGGMEFNYDYPYTATKSSCSSNKGKFILGVSSYNGYFRNEAWMQNYVLTTGPLSVCLNADTLSSYSSGIISSCARNNCTHAVQVVGVNTASSPPYWIVGFYVLFRIPCV